MVRMGADPAFINAKKNTSVLERFDAWAAQLTLRIIVQQLWDITVKEIRCFFYLEIAGVMSGGTMVTPTCQRNISNRQSKKHGVSRYSSSIYSR